jgi:hypothetical protein
MLPTLDKIVENPEIDGHRLTLLHPRYKTKRATATVLNRSIAANLRESGYFCGYVLG